MMKKVFLQTIWFFIIMAGGACYSAQNTKITINWCDNIIYISNVQNEANMKGKPDGKLAHLLKPNATVTLGGFGTQTTTLDTTSFAKLLQVSEAALSKADFVAFEYNGSRGAIFESSTWTFSNEVETVQVTHSFNNPVTSEHLIASGKIEPIDYHKFFNLTGPQRGGTEAFLLFDLPDSLVSDSSMTVQVQTGEPIKVGTPDPDAMGLIHRGSVQPSPAPSIIDDELGDASVLDKQITVTVKGKSYRTPFMRRDNNIIISAWDDSAVPSRKLDMSTEDGKRVLLTAQLWYLTIVKLREQQSLSDLVAELDDLNRVMYDVTKEEYYNYKSKDDAKKKLTAKYEDFSLLKDGCDLGLVFAGPVGGSAMVFGVTGNAVEGIISNVIMESAFSWMFGKHSDVFKKHFGTAFYNFKEADILFNKMKTTSINNFKTSKSWEDALVLKNDLENALDFLAKGTMLAYKKPTVYVDSAGFWKFADNSGLGKQRFLGKDNKVNLKVPEDTVAIRVAYSCPSWSPIVNADHDFGPCEEGGPLSTCFNKRYSEHTSCGGNRFFCEFVNWSSSSDSGVISAYDNRERQSQEAALFYYGPVNANSREWFVVDACAAERLRYYCQGNANVYVNYLVQISKESRKEVEPLLALKTTIENLGKSDTFSIINMTN